MLIWKLGSEMLYKKVRFRTIWRMVCWVHFDDYLYSPITFIFCYRFIHTDSSAFLNHHHYHHHHHNHRLHAPIKPSFLFPQPFSMQHHHRHLSRRRRCRLVTMVANAMELTVKQKTRRFHQTCHFFAFGDCAMYNPKSALIILVVILNYKILLWKKICLC